MPQARLQKQCALLSWRCGSFRSPTRLTLIFKQHIVLGLYIIQLCISAEVTGGNCFLWTVFWQILYTICHFTSVLSWGENGLSSAVPVAFDSTLKVYNELDDLTTFTVVMAQGAKTHFVGHVRHGNSVARQEPQRAQHGRWTCWIL